MIKKQSDQSENFMTYVTISINFFINFNVPGMFHSSVVTKNRDFQLEMGRGSIH